MHKNANSKCTLLAKHRLEEYTPQGGANMNERKDILERVKHLMKENSEIKVNCSKLARQLNCDRRTVSRYIYITRSGKEASQREYPKKTDGFEHVIEEKVKTTAPAITSCSLAAVTFTV